MKHRRPPSLRSRMRDWVYTSRARKWSVALASLLVVGLSVVLILRAVIPPIPPETDAPQEELVAFLAANNDRISSAQRDRLMDELARRYFDASAEQRKAFTQQWRRAGLDRSTREKIRTQMNFALAYNLAEQYQNLPPNQRDAYLDRVLFMVNAMGGGGEFLNWVEANPAADVFTDPVKAMRDSSPFERKLIYGTTAEQRAALPDFGRDLVKRAKRYQ
jgi:hypothetical protein